MVARIPQLQQWFDRQTPRHLAAGAGGFVLLLLILWLVIRSRRPTIDEMERRRRERLASMGRITDGSLIDTRTLANEESSSSQPEVLVYRYRIAGVIYECAQDVSRLADLVRDCQVGNAVQVRYDPRNPGNSILIAESWSGLWIPTRLAGEPLHDSTRSPCIRGNA